MVDIIRFFDRFNGTKESFLFLTIVCAICLVTFLLLLSDARDKKQSPYYTKEWARKAEKWALLGVRGFSIAFIITIPFTIFAMQDVVLSENKYSVKEFAPVPEYTDCIALTVQNDDGTEAELVFSFPNAKTKNIPTGTTKIKDLKTDGSNDSLIVRKYWGKKEVVLESCSGSELNDFLSIQELKSEIKN